MFPVNLFPLRCLTIKHAYFSNIIEHGVYSCTLAVGERERERERRLPVDTVPKGVRNRVCRFHVHFFKRMPHRPENCIGWDFSSEFVNIQTPVSEYWRKRVVIEQVVAAGKLWKE